MRVLLTGSREFADRDMVWRELDNEYFAWSIRSDTGPDEMFTVVHGKCPYGGADLHAQRWVEDRRGKEGFGLVVEDPHPPDIDQYGIAGYGIRNREMVQAGANSCLAFFWHGAKNKGTNMTVDLARKYGIPVRPYWGGNSSTTKGQADG